MKGAYMIQDYALKEKALHDLLKTSKHISAMTQTIIDLVGALQKAGLWESCKEAIFKACEEGFTAQDEIMKLMQLVQE